jgi:hypothetical protein
MLPPEEGKNEKVNILFDSYSGKVGFDSFSNFSHRFLSSFPHLPDGDDRKDFCEDHVEKDKKGDTASEDRPLYPGGKVKDHLIGNSWVGQCRYYNYKSLEPHPYDYRDRSDQCPCRSTGFFETENGQGDDETEEEHTPEVESEPSCKFGPKNGHMDGLSSIISRDIFRKGEIKP